jgi:hypothetical protein
MMLFCSWYYHSREDSCVVGDNGVVLQEECVVWDQEEDNHRRQSVFLPNESVHGTMDRIQSVVVSDASHTSHTHDAHILKIGHLQYRWYKYNIENP